MATSMLRSPPAAAGMLLIGLFGCADDAPAPCADGACTREREAESTSLDTPIQAQVSGGSSGLPCDVAAILASHCDTCHGEEASFGAPMSLTSAADFQAAAASGSKMHQAVKARINESDPRRAMPPASSPRLSAAQLATLNAWLDQGAPASQQQCGAGEAPPPKGDGEDKPVDTSGMECYKLTAYSGDLSTPFKVGIARDAYFNFTFKPPWQGTVYGKVLRPIIDNKNVIHHWLLFQDNTPAPVGGAKPALGAHPNAQLLTGWAPGGVVTDLTGPDDVGLELPGNTTYTVEFHYNSDDASAVDASGVEICVQKEKPRNIAALSWLGYDQLLVPAVKWTGTCRPASRQPITILSVTPHMHKTGTHMKAVINRANGQKEVLHDAPFDFNYQINYNKRVVLNPGDTITTDCTFSKPMAFGESTNAEMCYLFTMAFPKGALSDGGLWGTIAHGGGACLGQ